jgi:transposase
MGHRQRAEVLRAALAGRGGRGRAYPEALRRRAVAYFYERREEGAAVADIGPEIGLSWSTLARWEREMRGHDEPSPTFELVHVASSATTASSQGFVVHGPAGLRVEGLDMDGLVELLRRLS